MLEIKREGILLSRTSYEFESEGVMNPAVIKVDERIHMFYRAVAKGNYSSIGHAVFSSPTQIEFRNDRPLITPSFDYETHGVEDPRIVHFEGSYLLSYTAYDGLNASGAYATSTDLIHFEKKGLIVPRISYGEFSRLAGSKNALHEKYVRFNTHDGSLESTHQKKLVWDKNVVFFPRRINGKICFLHRIKPEIQIVAVDSLEELTPDFWQNYVLHLFHHIVLRPKFKHEVSYIGGGCPPIETSAGWLLIYHGVYDTIPGYIYCACACLLDIDNPQKEIARLPYPLFKPEEEWEKRGMVNNVCFPSGAIVENNILYIYYGAADDKIGCVSLPLDALLQELLKHSHENET